MVSARLAVRGTAAVLRRRPHRVCSRRHPLHQGGRHPRNTVRSDGVCVCVRACVRACVRVCV